MTKTRMQLAAALLVLVPGCALERSDASGADARDGAIDWGSECADFDLTGDGFLDTDDLVAAFTEHGDDATGMLVAIGQANLLPTDDAPFPIACNPVEPTACAALSCRAIDAFGNGDGVATPADLEGTHPVCGSLQECLGDLDFHAGWTQSDADVAESLTRASAVCDDLLDETCEIPSEATCDDGLDDDNDGVSDCDDVDCAHHAACAETCDGPICAAIDGVDVVPGVDDFVVVDVLGNDVFDGAVSIDVDDSDLAGWVSVEDGAEFGYPGREVLVYEPPDYLVDAYEATGPDLSLYYDLLSYTVTDANGQTATSDVVVSMDGSENHGGPVLACDVTPGGGGEQDCKWDVTFEVKSFGALIGGGYAKVTFTRKAPEGCNCPAYSVTGSTWIVQGGLFAGYSKFTKVFSDVELPCETAPLKMGDTIGIGTMGDVGIGPISTPDFTVFEAGDFQKISPGWNVGGVGAVLGAGYAGTVDKLKTSGVLEPCDN